MKEETQCGRKKFPDVDTAYLATRQAGSGGVGSPT